MTEQVDFAFRRPAPIIDLKISKYPSLLKYWQTSQFLINEMRACFEELNYKSAIKTIIAAGSIGRMEAATGCSDADLIIVLNDDIDLNSELAQTIYDDLWHTIAKRIKIEAPKKTGIFAKPTNFNDLVNNGFLSPHETYHQFAKRLIILMEGQPLFNDEAFVELRSQIIAFYSENYVANDPSKECVFILNDLIRFFRSGIINYRYDLEHEGNKWPIRNIKLRHSRLLMYSGMMLLIGETSKERKNKIKFLQDRLNLTPIERISHIYSANQDWNFHRIAACYEIFLGQINTESVRKALTIKFSEEVRDFYSSYEKRFEIPEFALLKNNSDALIAELLRFIMARRLNWSERFFEYLIF